MNNNSRCNTGLALVGLLALVVYILACTSFSPDDKQVLYPAFDASGAVGLAVYDRDTKKSDMLFVPASYSGNSSNAEPCLVRGRWLPDGRHIVVAWASPKNQPQETLQVAIVPVGRPGPLKVFALGELKEPGFALSQPLALVGDNLLVMAAEKQMLRLNLKSGVVVRHEFPELKHELTLYPSPESDEIFYIQGDDGDHSLIFGRVDPELFSLTPVTTITNEVVDGSFFTFDQHGSRVAFIEKTETNRLELVVLKNGTPELRKEVPFKENEVAFGNAAFAANGDVLHASFQRQSPGTNQSDFGFMEIPLKASGRVRETVLVRGLSGTAQEQATYFQFGCSHDGKTAALASTFLASEKQERNVSPALYLLDLSQPEWKVTSVPIPLPSQAVGK